jgi:hypothetical protein
MISAINIRLIDNPAYSTLNVYVITADMPIYSMEVPLNEINDQSQIKLPGESKSVIKEISLHESLTSNVPPD